MKKKIIVGLITAVLAFMIIMIVYAQLEQPEEVPFIADPYNTVLTE